MITMCEFAKRYGIQRVDVNTAVSRAELEALPEMKRGAYGRYARLYREKDIARAVMDYYREKREHHLDVARYWTARANEIAEKYKEAQKDGTV